MFIGYYELDIKEYFIIYFCKYWGESGYKLWYEDTFSPLCKNIKKLDFKISGNTYKEKQESLRSLAIDWQLDFSYLGWSYGELATIQDYFYKNGKRYGLLSEFKVNGIC